MHQFKLLPWDFYILILFNLFRFVKPRGIEKTATVQSRKGNFYMENNCVHGKIFLSYYMKIGKRKIAPVSSIKPFGSKL